MNTGLNLKSPSALVPNRESACPLETLKLGIDPPLAMKVLAFLSKIRPPFIYIENLFSAPTSLIILARSSMYLAATSVSALLYLTLHFYDVQMILSLNIMNQPLLASNFSSQPSQN